MSTVAASTVEELRAAHKVELVSGDYEGAPVNKVPAGLYGFTFSPSSFETPLFSGNSFLSFEVHRTEAGAVIVGYAEAEAAAKLESADSRVEIDVYPVAKETATKLIAIPHSRIASAKPVDRAHSNRLRLTVVSAG